MPKLEHNAPAAAAAVELRPATGTDWNSIAALLMRDQLPLDGALEHLANFFVAVSEEVVVGVAGFEAHGTDGLLRSVAIAPARRGEGVARRLVESVESSARRQGMATLFLLTTSAGDYFSRRGFTPLERADAPASLAASKEFRGACPASAVLMGKRLAFS